MKNRGYGVGVNGCFFGMRDSECQNNVRNGDDNSSYGRKDTVYC